MPNLNQTLMIATATARFQSFRLVAPPGPAAVVGNLLNPALKTASRLGASNWNPVAPAPNNPPQTATPLTVPPALFVASGNTVGDVASQRTHSDEFKAFIEKMCAAICQGHGQWRAAARLRGVRINGPVATGGRLDGPALAPLIKPHAPTSGCVGQAQRYSNAIADALSQAWKQFGDGVRVPGLPWYPAFTAFPGPKAPPMPNVPTPLLALPSGTSSVLGVNALKAAMVLQLGAPGPYSAALFDAIATGFAAAVTVWLPAQQVMNVLGKGPVPSFAPPYVPVGPVVMGDIIESPGHIAS